MIEKNSIGYHIVFDLKSDKFSRMTFGDNGILSKESHPTLSVS